MHPLTQLEDSLQKPEFYDAQFQKKGRLNFLFVETQLSTVSLYKAIFPFFYLYDVQNNIINFSTALTGLDKYDKNLQIASLHTRLTDEQIEWADVIFYPFTGEDLSDEYKRIKEKEKTICFNVDLNFYELPQDHPLKNIFIEPVIKNIEHNICNADYTITSNSNLQKYLAEKKYKGKPKTKFAYIPYFLGGDIVNSDIEADNAMLQLLKNTTEKNPSKIKVQSKGKKRNQVISKDNIVHEPINIGIVYSDLIDYTPFLDTFKKLNKLGYVTLVFIGYDPDKQEKDKFFGLSYSYVKNCSVKFYYKLIYNLKLDFCFIPLEDNIYNCSSENINRFLECGIFGVPVIAPDMYPYNSVLYDTTNGFLYKDKKDIIGIINFYSTMMPLVRNTIRENLIAGIIEKHVWNKDKANKVREIFLQ